MIEKPIIFQYMILACKIKYHQNCNLELAKARPIVIVTKKIKTPFSKDGKQVVFPTAITHSILRKNFCNKKRKQVNSVKPSILFQNVKLEENKTKISCLELKVNFSKQNPKSHQIEFDNNYTYMSCEIEEKKEVECHAWERIGHCRVASNPTTKKVEKRKKQQVISIKNTNISEKLQRPTKDLKKKLKMKSQKSLNL